MRNGRPALHQSSLGVLRYAALLGAVASLVAGCLFAPATRTSPVAMEGEASPAGEASLPGEVSPLGETQMPSLPTPPAAEDLAPEGSPAETKSPAVVGRTTTPQASPASREGAPGAARAFTVWVSDQIGPLPQSPACDVLRQQLVAFEAAHPGLTIELAIKRAQGAGGIEALLTTAGQVAPAVLPDLVALNTEQLERIAHLGLAVPLEELIAPEIQEDLYDLAHQATTVDGRWMGVQFQARGLQHAVYNPNKIAVAPLTWADLYSSGATYVFPAAGQEGVVNDAFLIQYLSTGASLVDEAGQPALDAEALADVLDFYQQGIERGAILTDVIEYATTEQSWPRFLQAEVVISNISSDLYLSVKTGQATAVPTRDGRAIILSRGHAWAITSRDPDRQLVAAKLVAWLLNPINMAAWSQAAGTLPARRAALLEMSRDPYVTFMYSQLENAVPYPTSETHLRIYRAMQQAVSAVLREGASPELAAEDVLKAVNQETR